MSTKCIHCGFPIDPIPVNESQAEVCPRCGEPTGDEELFPTPEELAGDAKGGFRPEVNFILGNTLVN